MLSIEQIYGAESNVQFHRCGGVRLVSFKGDSKKLTPKARWRILLGYVSGNTCLTYVVSYDLFRYQRPFDRHDWVVDRCGTRVRYVIDYYTGKTGPNGLGGNPLSFYIDARPALDTWQGVRMRFARFWKDVLSGGKENHK
jgi:cytochrome c heme-lyase